MKRLGYREESCKQLRRLQKALEKTAISEVQVSKSKLQEQRLKSKGFTRVEGVLQSLSKRQHRTLWVKCSSTLAASSHHSHVTKNENDEEPDKMYSPSQNSEKAVYALENLHVSVSPRSSNLVSQGYIRVVEPLHESRQSTGLKKEQYLWFRRSMFEEELGSPGDCIVDIAITKGCSRRRDDAIWSPPCQGFKRLNLLLRDSYFGEEVFVWYLKRDKTYLSDALQSKRDIITSLAGGTTKLELLERHMRDQVRARARELSQSQGCTMHQALESLVAKHMFLGLSTARSYVSRREFVRIMSNLSVTISARDVVAIFNKLDLAGSGWVNKNDVVEFFFFSDDEIKSLVTKLRKKLLAYSKEKGPDFTFTTLFQQIDKDSDHKLTTLEFHEFLQQVNIKLGQEEVSRLIDQLDLDGSGQVDYFEFVSFLNQSEKVQASLLNKRIRAAARKLYQFIVATASLGHPSGKLGTGHDWDRAWNELLRQTKGRKRGRSISAERLRNWLNKSGCTVSLSETFHLLNSIGRESQSLHADDLIHFASTLVPSEAHLTQDNHKRVKILPVFGGWDAGVDNALVALAKELRIHAKEDSMMSYFGLAETERLSCRRLSKRLQQEGTLSLVKHEYEQVVVALDQDRDGFVCEEDLRKFTKVGEHQRGTDVDLSRYSHNGRFLSDCHSDTDIESKEESCASDMEEQQGSGSNNESTWWLESEVQSGDNSLTDAIGQPTADLATACLRNRWIEHIDTCRRRSAGVASEGGRLDLDQIRAAAAQAMSRKGSPFNLQKEFSKYDAQGNGLVSLKHFRRVINKFGMVVPESQRKALARLVLDRHTGSCNYLPFCKMLETERPNDVSSTHERIWRQFKDKDYAFAFQAFDQLGEGFVTTDSFDEALRILNISLHPFDKRALLSIIQEVEDPSRLNYLKLDELVSLYHHQGASTEATTEVDESALFRLCKAAVRASGAQIKQADFYSYFEAKDEAGTGIMDLEEFSNAVKALFADCGYNTALRADDLSLICAFCNQDQTRASHRTVDYSKFCEHLNGVREIVLEGIDHVDLFNDFEEALRQLADESRTPLSAILNEFRLQSAKVSRPDFRRLLQRLGLFFEENKLVQLMEVANTDNDCTVDVDWLVQTVSTKHRKDWSELHKKIRKMLQRSFQRDPYFDARLCFAQQADGFVSFSNFAAGLRSLGIHLLREECLSYYRYLSKAKSTQKLRLSDLLCALQYNEEEMDNIAQRLYRRMLELEDAGINLKEELSNFKLSTKLVNVGHNSTISWADFESLSRKLGLPLSQECLTALQKRFSSPHSKVRCRHEDLLDFVVVRARDVAFQSS